MVGDGRRRLGTTADDTVDQSGCLATTPDDDRRFATKRDSYFRFVPKVVGDGRRRLGTTADDAVDQSGCLATIPDDYRRSATKRDSYCRLGRKWSAMVGDDWERLPTMQWTRPIAWQRHPTMTDAPRRNATATSGWAVSGRRRLGTTANDAVDTSDCSTTTLDEYRCNATKRVSCFRLGRKWSRWSATTGNDCRRRSGPVRLLGNDTRR